MFFGEAQARSRSLCERANVKSVKLSRQLPGQTAEGEREKHDHSFTNSLAHSHSKTITTPSLRESSDAEEREPRTLCDSPDLYQVRHELRERYGTVTRTHNLRDRIEDRSVCAESQNFTTSLFQAGEQPYMGEEGGMRLK